MATANLNPQQIEAIRALKAEGKAIEAIKHIRELTGLGLAEAKQIFDFLPATPEYVNVSTTTKNLELSDQQREELKEMFTSGNFNEGMRKVFEMAGMDNPLHAGSTDVQIGAQVQATSHLASSQPVTLSAQDLAQVQSMLASGNKIAAIKLVRERTGLGLAEAKRQVDAMQAPSGAAGIRPYEEVGTPIGKYLAVGGALLAIVAAVVWLLGRL